MSVLNIDKAFSHLAPQANLEGRSGLIYFCASDERNLLLRNGQRPRNNQVEIGDFVQSKMTLRYL